MEIAGIEPFSLCDFPGKVSCVVFVQGCNFNCPYCHNRPLIPFKKESNGTNKLISFLKTRAGLLKGVVISGGEPTCQSGLIEMLKEIRLLNFQIKLDTNGSNPNVIKRVIDERLVDFIAMDIKSPIEKYGLFGVDKGKSSIIESIDIISNSQIPHMFRTTWDRSLLSKEDILHIKKELVPRGSTYVIQDVRLIN